MQCHSPSLLSWDVASNQVKWSEAFLLLEYWQDSSVQAATEAEADVTGVHNGAKTFIKKFKRNLTSILKRDFENWKDHEVSIYYNVQYATEAKGQHYWKPQWGQINHKDALKCFLMHRSSHIQSVLIGIKYHNCCRTLDVYLLFAILIGVIQKLHGQHEVGRWSVKCQQLST